MPTPLLGYNGGLWNAEVAKTGNYTVVAADTGTLFTTVGNAAPLTFTLPSLAAAGSFVCWFWCTVAQNMIITAPAANSLILDGVSTATSCCYTTASHQIGSFAMVIAGDSGKFYCFNLGKTAATSA